MIVVKKPGANKDMLVFEIPSLKFITIEVDESIMSFKIVCLHNFDGDARLNHTGKANPRQGFLSPFYIDAPEKKIEDIKMPHEGRGRPRKEKAFDPNDENGQFLNGLTQN